MEHPWIKKGEEKPKVLLQKYSTVNNKKIEDEQNGAKKGKKEDSPPRPVTQQPKKTFLNMN